MLKSVATRFLEWDCAHRLQNHESKCATLHGHRYRAEITVGCEVLDSIGRVMDFGVIKTVVGSWIDTMWDHTTILSAGDPLLPALQLDAAKGARPPFVMLTQPTAENMARELFLRFREPLADRGGKLLRVRVWETPSCYGEARAEEDHDTLPPPTLENAGC